MSISNPGSNGAFLLSLGHLKGQVQAAAALAPLPHLPKEEELPTVSVDISHTSRRGVRISEIFLNGNSEEVDTFERSEVHLLGDEEFLFFTSLDDCLDTLETSGGWIWVWDELPRPCPHEGEPPLRGRPALMGGLISVGKGALSKVTFYPWTYGIKEGTRHQAVTLPPCSKE